MVVFPVIAAYVPITPLVTVAFCQATVPVAVSKLIVVPVPVQSVVATAASVPTAVGWLTVIFIAAEVAAEQTPLEAITLNQVSCAKAPVLIGIAKLVAETVDCSIGLPKFE